jgi:signal peptidase II
MAHRRVIALILICGVIILLDQISKHLIAANLELNDPLNLLGSVVRFTYIRNPNAAFGFSFGSRIPLLPIALFAILVLVLVFYRSSTKTIIGFLGLSAILGGAAGNLIDRIRFKEVIDFIDVGFGTVRWPVFNVADSCVTVGVILLVAGSLLSRARAVQGECQALEDGQ